MLGADTSIQRNMQVSKIGQGGHGTFAHGFSNRWEQAARLLIRSRTLKYIYSKNKYRKLKKKKRKENCKCQADKDLAIDKDISNAQCLLKA